MRATVLAVCTALIITVGSTAGAAQAQAAPVVLFQSGLSWPIQVAFVPDGRILVNELFTGLVRVVSGNGLEPEPLLDLNAELVSGETFGSGARGGLLGLALDPDYDTDPWVYVYYSYEAANGTPWNRIQRFLETSGGVGSSEILIDNIPFGEDHNGGKLAFGPDEMLYATTGDTFYRPSLAQDLGTPAGKILRIARNGSIPDDNPFPASPIFTLGHRNVFGIDFDPDTGTPYITENGPRSPDELNRLVPGGNYGWPNVIGIVGDSRYVDPILEWDQIAPTGIVFYGGSRIPEWRGSLIVGDFNYGRLTRVILADGGTRVASQEVVFDLDAPVLDIQEGPDGSIYVTSPNSILRVDESPTSIVLRVIALAGLVALAGVAPVLAIMLWYRVRRK